MDPDLDAPVEVGDVLASKYRVDRVLGVGGMGVVVAATHLQLGQTVALKFIRRDALVKTEIVARFEREVRTAVRLKSEHVARVMDVGWLETGSPYIVMEYLEGQDLAALLQQYRTIAVARACDFIIQACDAIAEAHSLGIVHRDLKPGNLFLANTSHGRQTVKVLDFGISKSHIAAGDLRMTSTQDVIGSPGYMSPEQMRSAKNVDGRTDIWSLGVILYELVTGQLPFQAVTLTELCLKVAMEPMPPLPALPALAPGLDAIIRRALEKDPARRYPSAADLAHALAPFAHLESRVSALRLMASAPEVVPGAMPLAMTGVVTTLVGATGESQGNLATHDRSRRFVFASVVIGVAAAIGIGVGLTWGGGGSDAKAPTADHATRPEVEAPRAARQPGGVAVPLTPTPQVHTQAATPPGILVAPGATAGPTAPASAQPSSGTGSLAKPVAPATPSKPGAPGKPGKGALDRPKDKVKPTPKSLGPYQGPD